MNLLSAFGGGLIIIPLITGIAAIIFFLMAYKASKSNSTTQLPGQQGTLDNTGNIPITKSGYFWFAVIAAVATVIIIILMIADK